MRRTPRRGFEHYMADGVLAALDGVEAAPPSSMNSTPAPSS
jgi:hypothetical protein